MAIIIANGTFDLLHIGHFNLLTHCRRLAGTNGMVAVLIDSDWRIKLIKNNPPIFSQTEREENLKMLNDVNGPMIDIVEVFHSDEDLIRLIKEIKPDYLIKGSDWSGKQVIGSDIAQVLFFRSEYKTHSSDIIKKIIERHEHRRTIGESQQS